MTYPFGDFVRTTMGAATNAADGSPLTPAQMREVATYLQSPGSGLTANSTFEEYVITNLASHPPRLPPNMDYVIYSGSDSAGRKNYKNAEAYIKSHGNAGLIGNSPWGRFIEDPASAPEKNVMADKLERFMTSRGLQPLGANYVGVLDDIMWNAGSEPYMRNAIASGRPIRGFVENAPLNRGFTNFELPTALTSPDTIFNGYPMRAFHGDVAVFGRQSATEIQNVEDRLVATTGQHSVLPVSLDDVRVRVDVLRGYDGVQKTLFGRPLEAFDRLGLDELAKVNDAWLALRFTPSIPEGRAADVKAAEIGLHPSTGPPATSAPEAANATRTMKLPVPGASGMATAGLHVAGTAFIAYDSTHTVLNTSDLLHQGNLTGAQSSLVHFGTRTLGWIGGAELVGGAFALAGAETGPGAFLLGTAGAIVGGWAGDKVADKID